MAKDCYIDVARSCARMSSDKRPISVLIAAMGGEGGGVLTDWIVKAAEDAGVLVQSTSIPGVAQRTGATTYYVEIFPVLSSELDGDSPVFALYPLAGNIDLMIASELLEAARAVQNGFVSPNRTTLIASSHRVYTIDERSDMADGRLDEARLRNTIMELSRFAVLDDLKSLSEKAGSVLNAVILGAVAATSVITLVQKENFISAIRAGGKAVESNLAGFEVGFQLVENLKKSISVDQSFDSDKGLLKGGPITELRPEILGNFPVPKPVQEIIQYGIQRVISFQDKNYAELYAGRVERVCKVDSGNDKILTKELARQLALRMTYEDVIRVAQLKTDPERTNKVREEVRASPNEPVRVIEYLKPGVEELCSILPGVFARPLLRWSNRKNLTDKLHIGLTINSSSISGFLVLWLLARLRFVRRFSYRFREEQKLIDSWLDHVCAAGIRSNELALGIVSSARLIKGYGDTHRRGLNNYRIIEEKLIEPTLEGQITVEESILKINEAVELALSDPGGTALKS